MLRQLSREAGAVRLCDLDPVVRRAHDRMPAVQPPRPLPAEDADPGSWAPSRASRASPRCRVRRRMPRLGRSAAAVSCTLLAPRETRRLKPNRPGLRHVISPLRRSARTGLKAAEKEEAMLPKEHTRGLTGPLCRTRPQAGRISLRKMGPPEPEEVLSCRNFAKGHGWSWRPV